MSLSPTALTADPPAKRTRGESTGRKFILLVTALTATCALGIDLMLPAFPEGSLRSCRGAQCSGSPQPSLSC